MGTELIIFDCDGVLVDSETAGNEVLREVIGELGMPMSLEETLRRFKGRAMRDIWHEVGEAVGRPVDAATYEDFRRRQYARLAEGVELVPGIAALLEALPARACVASNGPHEKMRITLGQVGLWDRLEGHVYSRTDVARPKPHPDLFEHAAASEGVDAGACLVLEDSPLGIEAALRAGMRAVGLAATATADAGALRAAGAEAVLDRPGALLDLL